MSARQVSVAFDGLSDADAGRLAAELEDALASQVQGVSAKRLRTDPGSQDLGTGLLITFLTEAAVVVVFKLIEKYMDRRVREARLTIDLVNIDSALALEIVKHVDRKSMSERLAAEVDRLIKPTATA